MRIGVIGAGAIGGTIAALLDRAGHDVAITARGEQLETIRASGLRVSGGWGEHTARPRASAVLDVPPELAFVCTKAQDAAGAITANAEWLAGIPVVIVQNGLDGVRIAEELLPGSPIVGAIAVYAASYLRAGLIDVTAAGPTIIGTNDPTRRDIAAHVSSTLGAAMPTQLVSDFRGAQWSKLIVNQVNAMPAITGLSAQVTLVHPVLGRIVTGSMREAVRIGFATGVRFASLQGLSQPLLRAFAMAPISIGRVLPRVMASRMGDTPNPGSTLQSIRRGQPTEIDYLNGAVVRAARASGLTAPINETLTELVHRVEKSGDFLEVEEVAAVFRRIN
ncbi:ketopantoate reductase family protein [Agreia bicolorata]|uniref:2-dehydropantoate 2-reductase n=1 Tax=Agreia bicolorata TaxID=110935 RepID=A0ABR5CIJ8_9MICO|nr:2-dehydropantoate 2-reductase [Agreia bicolorata]KJC65493.1 2-dehydropantoate 2-reductase [Agreia bicolorata]